MPTRAWPEFMSAGSLDAAREEYAAALALYEETGMPGASWVRDRLAALTPN